jgi:hypothetical protein
MAALSAFAKYVRPDVPGCPDIMILDAILRAGIEFCKRTKIIKQSLSINTVIGQASYVINTTAGTVADEVLQVNRGKYDELTRSSFKEFENCGLDKLNGHPQYFYMDAGHKLVLGNIPNSVEALDIVVRIRPTEDATTLPDELADRYLFEIASGAKSVLMLMAKQAWSDPQLASVHRGLFQEAIDGANLREAKGASRTPLRVASHFF